MFWTFECFKLLNVLDFWMFWTFGCFELLNVLNFWMFSSIISWNLVDLESRFWTGIKASFCKSAQNTTNILFGSLQQINICTPKYFATNWPYQGNVAAFLSFSDFFYWTFDFASETEKLTRLGVVLGVELFEPIRNMHFVRERENILWKWKQ